MRAADRYALGAEAAAPYIGSDNNLCDHDQVEALTMSSNIAVMKEGVLQQLDTPTRFTTILPIYLC